MIRTVTRRIFDTGNSRTFALPRDWSGKDTDRVFVLYDDYLLIIPEDLAEQETIERFAAMLKKPTQERAPDDEEHTITQW